MHGFDPFFYFCMAVIDLGGGDGECPGKCRMMTSSFVDFWVGAIRSPMGVTRH